MNAARFARRLAAPSLAIGALSLVLVASPASADGSLTVNPTTLTVPVAPTEAHLTPGEEGLGTYLSWEDNSIEESRYEAMYVGNRTPRAAGKYQFSTVTQFHRLGADTRLDSSNINYGDMVYAGVRACNAAGCSAWTMTYGPKSNRS
jgi:hypothetical protein